MANPSPPRKESKYFFGQEVLGKNSFSQRQKEERKGSQLLQINVKKCDKEPEAPKKMSMRKKRSSRKNAFLNGPAIEMLGKYGFGPRQDQEGNGSVSSQRVGQNSRDSSSMSHNIDQKAIFNNSVSSNVNSPNINSAGQLKQGESFSPYVSSTKNDKSSPYKQALMSFRKKRTSGLELFLHRTRLERIQQVLGKGLLINQSKIEQAIGSDFEIDKQQHQKMMQDQLNKLKSA